ncbi:Nucleotidyltransferase, partial [Coemansia reversa NRRL 1564]
HGKRPDISEMLNEEVEKFTAYISPTPEEHQMRQWVIERMQRVLDSMYLPGITPIAKCFGSFETQMYLPTSDIDMTVMLYDTRSMSVSENYSYKEAIQKFLYSLAGHMRKNGFCTNCQVIARARVPIIKTNERISGIAVDISINADSGMKSAAVQRSLSENTYPGSLRPIVLAIKQFLYQRSMNEVYTGGLGSYAITLLVVSLLQMHPRIRSGGLDVSKNLGVILVEFFELYGKRFNYDNTCVGVLEQGQYLCKRRKGFYNPTQPYLLSIEDPCDPSNDVTKGTHGINRIKQTFGGAYDLLNNAIFAYHQTR